MPFKCLEVGLDPFCIALCVLHLNGLVIVVEPLILHAISFDPLNDISCSTTSWMYNEQLVKGKDTKAVKQPGFSTEDNIFLNFYTHIHTSK